jgi:DNA (cytosine-5)-methyltransferase 1
MKAIDFFCGAGGLSYGLSKSGITVLGGIDVDVSFKETYEFNNPKSVFLPRNIKTITFLELSEKFGIKKFEDDLLFAGCAPCQAFSQQRRSNQVRDDQDVIVYFGKFVSYFQPGFVFIENVKKFEKSKEYAEFRRILDDNGYKVNSGIVNAADFGVPQSRTRFILLASRFSRPLFPEAKFGLGNIPYKTVRDSISDLPNIEAGENYKLIPNHQAALLSDKNLKRIRFTPKNGGSWNAWPESYKLACHKKISGYTDVYGRMSWDKPSPTLTCKCNSISNGRFGHPEQNRGLSLREAARLQTFPDNYIFFGGITNIAKQIGNAVPIELAKIFGQQVQNSSKSI